MAGEDVAEVQAVLVGDAQLTDFTPANVLPLMHLLAMVDSERPGRQPHPPVP